MPYIKVNEGDDFVEISHVNDLVANNIPVPDRWASKLLFIVVLASYLMELFGCFTISFQFEI